MVSKRIFFFLLFTNVLITARTPASFLSAQLELNLLKPADKLTGSYANVPFNEFQEQFKEKAFALSTKCMLDLRFKGIQASAIAAAIVYYCRTFFQFQTIWTEELSRLTQHDPLTSKSARKALDMLFEMREDEQENDENILTDLLDDIEFQEAATPAVTPIKQSASAPSLSSPAYPIKSANADHEILSPVSVNYVSH